MHKSDSADEIVISGLRSADTVVPALDDEVAVPDEAQSQPTPRKEEGALESAELIGVSDAAAHIVLLGDSTLDNARYLEPGEQSVEAQLERRCKERGWGMTLLAQDGSTLDDVACNQIPFIPDCATHIVLSASGNNLLALLNELAAANFSPSALWTAVKDGLREVANSYRRVLQAILACGCHVACCTVYRPNFNHIFLRSLASMSLGMHNTRIREITMDLDVSVVDFASIFDSSEDFANPLELSTQGGAKVVANLLQFVRDHHPSQLPRNAAMEKRIRRQACWSVDPVINAMGLTIGCCGVGQPSRMIYNSNEPGLGPEKIEPFHRTSEREQTDASSKSMKSGANAPAEFSQAQDRWRTS